jgi:hypothetical protein
MHGPTESPADGGGERHGDGKKDLLRLHPKVARTDDALSWELNLYTHPGEVARGFTGKGVPLSGRDATPSWRVRW